MNPPMKKTFQDDKGQTWAVAITTATLKRVQSLCDGFAFDSLISKPKSKRDDPEAASLPLREFLEDAVRFSNVLWAILKPDADAKAITQDAFDEQLYGDVLVAAQDAFLGALHDFFPPAPRMVVRGLIEMRRMMAQANRTHLERAEKMLEEMTPAKIRDMTNQEIDAALSKSAIASPETSASTPAPSLSVS